MPNPQAMASTSSRTEYLGSSILGTSVDTDTWLTPRFILSQLGHFDLDPCAAESSRNWTGTTNTFVKAEDGLHQEWAGRVFLNPPFSNTSPWLRRHAKHGNGVSLVPASVESVIWREIVWQRAKAVLLLHGRTRFCNPDGSSTTGRPLRSISLIAWTEYDAEILERSALAGVLLQDWRCR